MCQDSFYLPVLWLSVLLCLALFSNWVEMGGNWPLASPSFCHATSHQSLPLAIASQKPAEPGACGAHSLVIWSTGGGGREEDLRIGTLCLVVCPQAFVQPGSQTRCGVEEWGTTWLTGYPKVENGQLGQAWDPGSIHYIS